MLLNCELSNGLRDSEVLCKFTDVTGRRHFIRVEREMLVDGRLPVDVITQERGLALVELPTESETSVRRVLVWVTAT